MKDHTNQEAADHFGCAVRTIASYLQFCGLTYYDLKYADCPKELSPIQEEVINGTMLGDAHIRKRYGYYRFKQSTKYKEYVEHIAEMLKPFSKPIKIAKTKKPNNIDGKVINMDHWNGEYLEVCYFDTPPMPLFKTLRTKWYPEGKKIVPKDVNLTPRTISYWMSDDGSVKHKTRETTFHTNGFSIEDVDFLINKFKELGFNATKQKRGKGHIIAISARSYFDFMDMIRPYCPAKCMEYKFDTSKTPIARPGWGTDKLNMEKAIEIRKLYDTDQYRMKDLAKMFGVCQTSIARIINNQIYKQEEPTINTHGSADAKLTFNYEAESDDKRKLWS